MDFQSVNSTSFVTFWYWLKERLDCCDRAVETEVKKENGL